MSIQANFPAIRPSLNLDFANTRALDPRITFGRASNATRFNSMGVMETVGNNVPRIDYDPATLLPSGLLIEEQRTNSIRNNTMQGAVAGTPGTLPTNWVTGAIASGLTASVLGTGTLNGINYIDIRISGTTADTDGWRVNLESTTQIPAASGQSWTASAYFAIIGGSTTNIQAAYLRVTELDGSGGYITESNVSLLTASATLQRFVAIRPSMGATVGYVTAAIYFSAASGVPIDITLRIGLPQLEQGAFATSVIQTTGTAATRAADVATMTGANFSNWYNQSEGTIYCEVSSLSQLTATQSVAAGKYPYIFNIESGATDTYVLYYGINIEASIGGSYINFGTVPTGVNKLALAMAATGGQSARSLNGAAAVNVSGNNASNATLFGLGGNGVGSSATALNGHIRRIAYYPLRISNAELQTITA